MCDDRMYFVIHTEIDDEELKDILSKLSEAQETILNCYHRLQQLGLVKIQKKDETVNGN